MSANRRSAAGTPAERRLRICLLAGDYAVDAPASTGGGIETYVRVMARGLAEAGHDVHVVGPARRRPGTHRGGLVHVHAVHVPDDWRAADGDLGEARAALSFAWYARRRVRALIHEGGPFDVVEAPEYKAQGYFLAQDPDVPLVVKCHAHLRLCLALNGVALGPDTALLSDLERETLLRATAVHANSRALAARCAADYGLDVERFTHVPYGIDTRRFAPTLSPLRGALAVDDRRVVLFVGRMEVRKGIETLVPAFATVATTLPDVVLVLAGPDTHGPPGGDGNIRWMTEQWASLGVGSDRLRVLDTVAHHDLPAMYSAADVMVAPSPFEAFGLVYLEAMACGVPVIACRDGGAPEVVRDGLTGLLVPPDDAPALALAMLQLLDAPQRRAEMGAHGRALVARDYSLDAVVQRTASFYRGVAA